MATVTHLGLFPSCIPKTNPDELDYTSNNLFSSMAFFWRVKKFKFEVTCTLYAPVTGEILETEKCGTIYTKAIWPEEDDQPIIIPSENYIGCGFNTFITENYGNGWNTEGIVYSIRWMDGDDVYWDLIFKSGSGYYRQAYIVTTRSLGLEFYADEILNPRQIGDVIWEETELILNESENLKINALSATSEDGQILKPEFTVLEWFEYDPNDGKGPIYDKDTGERIRSDV